MPELVLIVAAIIIALIFDFGNGLHDASNAIATVVSTKVLSLRAAVIMAAIGNFSGFFIFGVAVAKTVGKGLIDPSIVNPYVIICALIGAIVWVYGTVYFGIPVSSSHSLIGGLIGAAVAAAGLKAIIFSGVLKVVLFIFLAPIIGLVGGTLFSVLIIWIFRKKDPEKINKHFKKIQMISALSYSISHGSNDAQKTMGIIALLLFSAGYLGGEFHVPFWVILTSYSAMALGTLLGGKKIIKTLGMKLTHLRPVGGFCAETAGSITVMGCSLAGIPVSTTHVISGSIAGVGMTKRVSAVRWGLARNIVWAWIITIPFSAIVGGLFYTVVRVILL